MQRHRCELHIATLQRQAIALGPAQPFKAGSHQLLPGQLCVSVTKMGSARKGIVKLKKQLQKQLPHPKFGGGGRGGGDAVPFQLAGGLIEHPKDLTSGTPIRGSCSRRVDA